MRTAARNPSTTSYPVVHPSAVKRVDSRLIVTNTCSGEGSRYSAGRQTRTTPSQTARRMITPAEYEAGAKERRISLRIGSETTAHRNYDGVPVAMFVRRPSLKYENRSRPSATCQSRNPRTWQLRRGLAEV